MAKANEATSTMRSCPNGDLAFVFIENEKMPSVHKDFCHYSLLLKICATSLINENQIEVDSPGGGQALGWGLASEQMRPGLSEDACPCQPVVLLQRPNTIQCPQADFFWRSIYKWRIGRVRVF